MDQQEECAICMDKPANCVVVPCGHQCGCEQCLNRLKSLQNKCPICRGTISSIMKVIPSGVQPENFIATTTTMTTTPTEEKTVGFATPLDLPNISLEVLPLDVEDKRDNVTNAVVRISVPEPKVEGEEEEEGEGLFSRLPVDVVAVIDISGSMGADATYEVDGEVRSDGLRLLDIAIHAVKVILASLRKEDRFSLIAFDQFADLKFPLRNMTVRNRKEAVKVASELKERGQTNIWGGIMKGMDSLRTAKPDTKYPNRNQVVLLLTDGQPTTTPQGGHVKAFETYCQKHKFDCQLSCFGLGYSLDSKLMLDMSQVGGGTFAFIPVAPVLGTVFTHALASALSTYTTNSKLILTAPRSGGGSFVQQKIKGGLQTKFNGYELEIDVGPLLFGQTRDIVVPMRFFEGEKDKVILIAKLQYGNYQLKELTAEGKEVGYDSNAEIAKIRSFVSDTLLEVVSLGEKRKLDDAKEKLKDLTKLMEESGEAFNERVVGLKKDITGRCTKALNGRPRFNRWGKHYIRALLRAHAVQQCTNKLDIGVQVYGGTLFALMRQRGDDIFIKLPPPQPRNPDCPMCGKTYTRETIEAHTNRCMSGGSGTSYSNYSSSYTASSSSSSRTTSSSQRRTQNIPAPTPAPAPRVNITRYTAGDEGGGCFGAESTVVVVSEGVSSTIRVADVKKGDIVRVSGNETAEVVCVVEAIRKDPKPLVAIPGGLFITSKHPLRVNGRWRMPGGMGPMVEAGGNGTVYNFVLEPRNALLLVNGYECVALGHGLKGNVVEHAFYGTERSLKEVQKLKGWDHGKVSVGGIVRDKQGHAAFFK